MGSAQQAIAKRLFGKINNFIAKTGLEQNWLDAKGNFLAVVNLSTDEKWAREEPWKGIFYLRFFYTGKEDDKKPTMVGIGSFAANEITVDSALVTKEITDLLVKFGFAVIAYVRPNMTFEEMKKKVLPGYQHQEAERAKKYETEKAKT